MKLCLMRGTLMDCASMSLSPQYEGQWVIWLESVSPSLNKLIITVFGAISLILHSFLMACPSNITSLPTIALLHYILEYFALSIFYLLRLLDCLHCFFNYLFIISRSMQLQMFWQYYCGVFHANEAHWNWRLMRECVSVGKTNITLCTLLQRITVFLCLALWAQHIPGWP